MPVKSSPIVLKARIISHKVHQVKPLKQGCRAVTYKILCNIGEVILIKHLHGYGYLQPYSVHFNISEGIE